jgi:pyruvate/2-oxoacid:ferredoxin oxidoreductase beta subunit
MVSVMNVEYEQKLGVLPTLTGMKTHYCPGCEHGTLTRLIASAIHKLGIREKSVMVDSVGCSVLASDYIDIDHVQAPHGRAPAVMYGIKSMRPDLIVFSVQGDGDALSIGFQELFYAALRGEPGTIFLVNNGIYGMTGGQMAPTTPEGMVTTTTPFGRDAKHTGSPFDATRLLSMLERPAYIRRAVLSVLSVETRKGRAYTSRGPIEAVKIVENAFRVQMMGGFSFVEFLSTCNVNWKMSVLDSKKYVADVMSKIFPPGIYRDTFGVESG